MRSVTSSRFIGVMTLLNADSASRFMVLLLQCRRLMILADRVHQACRPNCPKTPGIRAAAAR
jgi:hypothetical protein